MKRLNAVQILAGVLILGFCSALMTVMAPADRTEAGVQNGFLNTTSVWFKVDSTALHVRDTFTTDAAGNYLGQLTIPRGWDAIAGAKLDGYIAVYYSHVDTGTTGAPVDSAKDTVYVDVITAASGGTPWKVLKTLTFTPAGPLTYATLANASYQDLGVPADSTIWNLLYLRFRTTALDSIPTKARLAAKIKYGFYGWWGTR